MTKLIDYLCLVSFIFKIKEVMGVETLDIILRQSNWKKQKQNKNNNPTEEMLPYLTRSILIIGSLCAQSSCRKI